METKIVKIKIIEIVAGVLFMNPPGKEKTPMLIIIKNKTKLITLNMVYGSKLFAPENDTNVNK